MEKLHSEKGWKRWILKYFSQKGGEKSLVSGFIKQTIFPATMGTEKPQKTIIHFGPPIMRILNVECFCWICHIFQTVDARVVFCPVPELPTTTVLHLFGQLTNYPILALVLVHYSSKSGVSEDLDNK